jgi:hypothetical protein
VPRRPPAVTALLRSPAEIGGLRRHGRTHDEDPDPPSPDSCMQVDWAFWNVGDCGLTDEVPENPPFLFGSGKSGTPCVRMHLANFSSLARFAPDAGFDVPPPRKLWHACLADWYCGELWSIPSAGVILNPTDPFFTVGSGNFGTPCDRMHAAYSTAFAAAPDADDDDDADGEADAPATPGPAGPLEHPAASTPAPASAVASRPARRTLSPPRTAEAIHGIANITHSLPRNESSPAWAARVQQVLPPPR